LEPPLPVPPLVQIQSLVLPLVQLQFQLLDSLLVQILAV
jgi:hypothetical protein